MVLCRFVHGFSDWIFVVKLCLETVDTMHACTLILLQQSCLASYTLDLAKRREWNGRMNCFFPELWAFLHMD